VTVIAALPMYDWPERRAEVDAEWVVIRDAMRARGIEAPEKLTRRNADMPAVPGGIRDEQGTLIAADPATLPPDEFDLATLWHHPALLFGQTCWAPMEFGLSAYVALLNEPDYHAVEGGRGGLYSSAIVMRRAEVPSSTGVKAPADGLADIPISLIRGKRFAFNGTDSMSGHHGFKRDLEKTGETLDIFSALIATGSHRSSIQAIAADEADFATIDTRSWHLARRYEPAAQHLTVVGWTALRPGCPFISAKGLAAAARRGLGLDRHD
jgi:ABC-type phosphate/phosphonate transport system substrate-binding protein